MNLSQKDIEQLNSMETFLSYKQTWLFHRFINCPAKVIGLFCGNQAFKTSASARQYVMRIFGTHPVPENNLLYFECESRACKNGHRSNTIPKDNICQECGAKFGKFTAHKYTFSTVPRSGKCTQCHTKIHEHIRGTRIIRLASETLPSEKEDTGPDGRSAEIKNTIYPEIKKWLPKFLIKKDITVRQPAITVQDPHGRGDIILEFSSYSQPLNAVAGVQRAAIYCDEEPSIEFWEEQKIRLIAENADIIMGLTPANQMTWTFDEIFEKAAIYYRTPIICKILQKDDGIVVPPIEETDSKASIAVFQAATDDNPTLDEETIDQMFDTFEDEDVIATRRYGIFKASTGRIFDFNYRTHLIDGDKYLPDGVYHDWVHARMCDYHESTPWAISFIAINQYDEAFIYNEYNPSPERLVTRQITRETARKSMDYKYAINLIDPLAVKTQTNTGLSVVDDFNEQFRDYKKEGLCTGGHWESWDTKSTRGRDIIRQRLANSKACKVPFNNLVFRDGREVRLPTLWVLDNCRVTAIHLKNWRKGKDDKPTNKNSHFCTAIEAVFKDVRFRAKRESYRSQRKTSSRKTFQGVR